MSKSNSLSQIKKKTDTYQTTTVTNQINMEKANQTKYV
jgi:hypothetical protein